MLDRDYVRSAVLQAALDDAPPMVRASLLEDAQFRSEYGLTTDGIVTFGERTESWFQRSRLFSAVRRVLGDRSEADVVDTDGQKWKVKASDGTASSPKLVLSQSGRQIDLPRLAGLSPDRNERLQNLNEIVADVNLGVSAAHAWAEVLTVRALDDEEVTAFFQDVRDTPVETERSILRSISKGSIGVAELVPASRRYFERLVGRYDGSKSIGEYATGGAKSVFEQLRAWRRYEGAVMSLYLAWHSALAEQMSIDGLNDGEMLQALESVRDGGDTASQLGAIEVGLGVVDQRPEAEPLVRALIAKVREDAGAARDSGFRILAGLFVLVDGEIARRRIFSEEPPFYRRLASLAHAALVHRQLLRSGIDLTGFSEWAFGARGRMFFAQSIDDQRREPRWCAYWGSEPAQLRAEFLARIVIASKGRVDAEKGGELYDMVLEVEKELPVSAYWPGPLEGVRATEEGETLEIEGAIEKEIGRDPLKPDSFAKLVTLGFLGRVKKEHGDLAAWALRSSGDQFGEVDDNDKLWAVLRGLATVAAVSGSGELGEELRIVMRNYRSDGEHRLGMDQVMEVGLVAAASRVEDADWRDFIGEWFTELAFGELRAEEGELVHSYLRGLCQVVPGTMVVMRKGGCGAVGVQRSMMIRALGEGERAWLKI